MNDTLYQRFTLPECLGEWLIPPCAGLPFMGNDRATAMRAAVVSNAEVQVTHVRDSTSGSWRQEFVREAAAWSHQQNRPVCMIDSSVCSIPLSANQPYLIPHLQNAKHWHYECWDQVMFQPWLPPNSKQLIHFNEVISAIAWPLYNAWEAISEVCHKMSAGEDGFNFPKSK